LRPMACVWSRKIVPMTFFVSPKYSRGLTRTRAPVGQFSSHEYARVFLPFGLSGVPSQRLHLTAWRFFVSLTLAGSFCGVSLRSSAAFISQPGGGCLFFGIIVMAL